MDIAIIGGGIAGLSLALNLHARGIACRVYEAAPEVRELGVGITVASGPAVSGAPGRRQRSRSHHSGMAAVRIAVPWSHRIGWARHAATGTNHARSVRAAATTMTAATGSRATSGGTPSGGATAAAIVSQLIDGGRGDSQPRERRIADG